MSSIYQRIRVLVRAACKLFTCRPFNKEGTIYSLLSFSDDVVTLFKDIPLDTLTTGKRYHCVSGVVALGDHEDVVQPGGKLIALGIAYMHNIEASRMALLVDHDTNAPSVSAVCTHDHVTDFEFDNVKGLIVFQIKFDSIVTFDEGVVVADGTSIVGDNVRDSFLAVLLALDSAKFELGFSFANVVQYKASLSVVEEAEAVTRLGHLDNIHKADREVKVSSYFIIDLYELLHANKVGFPTGHCVFQPVP